MDSQPAMQAVAALKLLPDSELCLVREGKNSVIAFVPFGWTNVVKGIPIIW